jgi:hypothetical protein
MPMHKIPIPDAIYLTADQIEQLIKELQADASALEDGPDRQTRLKEIARLRIYAEAKRWIASPGLKPGR